MKVSENSSNDFESPEPGSYPALCYKIIDLGTQTDTYQGKENTRRQVLVGWELEHLMTDGRPFTVVKTYTASLNEKATLRKDLESWRSVKFTPEELAEFNLKVLLGAPCMVAIGLSSTGKTKVNSVIKLPKGMEKPAPHNPTQYFSLDEPDMALFEKLSEWTRKKITQSPEYQKLMAEPGSAAHHGKSSDDIPF